MVDWFGRGSKDLLVSTWEGCYEAGAWLFPDEGRRADGTPQLGPGHRIPGLPAHLVVLPTGDGRFDLLAAPRRRPSPLLYRNVGEPGAPRFAPPVSVTAAGEPLLPDEIMNALCACDLDGDGRADLIVGTDFWDDYWPEGREWNEAEYRPYDEAGRWRGGPLRGHVYFLRRTGGGDLSLAAPEPLKSAGRPLEVYGAASPCFGDFLGRGRTDLICTDFLDRVHFFPHVGPGPTDFGPAMEPATPTGPLVLPQCIHFSAADDWDSDGLPDLLAGAEDGNVYYMKNLGRQVQGGPGFAEPARLQCRSPRLHGGVLPVPAAGDWDGDGLVDLVVGNAAGYLLFLRNVGTPASPCFERPVRLAAGGAEIRVQAGETGSIQGPSEKKWGYTCPVFTDWDGDGLDDLLLSDILGEHLFYRNIGTPRAPRLAPAEPLRCGGRPLRTVWRVRPAVTDWGGAGRHYVCLDEQGLLASYPQESPADLGPPALLRYANGDPIAVTEDYGGGRGRVKLCICDWTGDGLPDVLVGTQHRASLPPGPGGLPRHDIDQATVLLLENVGRPDRPVFAPARYVKYRGEPLRLGMHACSPEAVDWTGGGRPDLIVGAEGGSLLWLRRDLLSW